MLGERTVATVGVVLGVLVGVVWMVAINLGRAYSGAHVRGDQTPRRIVLEVAALVLVVGGPVALAALRDRGATRMHLSAVLGGVLVVTSIVRFAGLDVPQRLFLQNTIADAATLVLGVWMLATAWWQRRGGDVRPLVWLWLAVHVSAAALLVVSPAAPPPHGPPAHGLPAHVPAPHA